MTHYAHILTIDQLEIMTHLGFYDEERNVRQKTALSLRLYFPEAPPCARDDYATFMDYGALCNAIHAHASAGEYRLLEFMGMTLFDFTRSYLDQHHGEKMRIWMKLTKCNPPVPHLVQGASFIHSDIPAGATTAFTPVL